MSTSSPAQCIQCPSPIKRRGWTPQKSVARLFPPPVAETILSSPAADDALLDLLDATDLQKGRAHTWARLGNSFLAAHRFKEAAKLLQEANRVLGMPEVRAVTLDLLMLALDECDREIVFFGRGTPNAFYVMAKTYKRLASLGKPDIYGLSCKSNLYIDVADALRQEISKSYQLAAWAEVARAQRRFVELLFFCKCQEALELALRALALTPTAADAVVAFADFDGSSQTRQTRREYCHGVKNWFKSRICAIANEHGRNDPKILEAAYDAVYDYKY